MFVNVLAWIFAIFSGLSTFVSILQNILLHVMLAGPQFERSMQRNGPPAGTPAAVEFMFNNFRLFVLAFLVVSAATFVASIGLLKRRNWARLLFVCLMGLGIVWNLAGFAFQLDFLTSMSELPASTTPEARHRAGIATTLMLGFSGVMVLGFSILFGWIIKRLLSPEIAREFRDKA